MPAPGNGTTRIPRGIKNNKVAYNRIVKRKPNPQALKLAAEVRKRLSQDLGQTVKVILYGSQARGDATAESDVDLLVLLPRMDKETRILISDIAREVGFDAGQVITTMAETINEWERLSKPPFYNTVKRDGVIA